MEIKTNIYQIFTEFTNMIGGDIGEKIREIFYRLAGMRIGKNPRIHEQIRIFHPYNIEMGDDVGIGRGSIIAAQEYIKIGNNVIIAPYCCIYDHDHVMPLGNKKEYVTIPVIIEDGVWIGCNSVILKGVKIGKNATIGAGSVVTKNVPNNGVVGGVPAKEIKNKTDEELWLEYKQNKDKIFKLK